MRSNRAPRGRRVAQIQTHSICTRPRYSGHALNFRQECPSTSLLAMTHRFRSSRYRSCDYHCRLVHEMISSLASLRRCASSMRELLRVESSFRFRIKAVHRYSPCRHLLSAKVYRRGINTPCRKADVPEWVMRCIRCRYDPEWQTTELRSSAAIFSAGSASGPKPEVAVTRLHVVEELT